MKADVVVVAYRSEGEIARCVSALTRERGVASVTVIDNGDGRSAAIAESLGAIAIHVPANPGFGAAVNRGATGGDAEAILVLNPDAILQPGIVATALSRLEHDPMLGAVQGAIVNVTTAQPERSAGRELGLVHLIGRALGLRALLRFGAVQLLARRSSILRDHVDRRPDAPHTVETLAATAIVLRRSAFEEINGFDEGYFLYGEDLDLCRRLRDAGWRLQSSPETWATHRSGGSAATAWDRELTWWEGTLRFARVHWSRRRVAVAMAIGILEAALLIGRAPARTGEVLRASWRTATVRP
jgi:N-acetylglucosaminyl-diphospho-decaprenol L-rhamnosyltransferase